MYLRLSEALLDSGTTHHIFSHRDFFTSLDSTFSLPIMTANNTSLPALGQGDVSLVLQLDSGPGRLTSRGCLYAPAVPVNLVL